VNELMRRLSATEFDEWRAWFAEKRKNGPEEG
jgi:hypothetical protein